MFAIPADLESAEVSPAVLVNDQGTPRAEMVQAILAGNNPPIDRASERLGHRLRLLQTGLILWLDEESPEASQTLEVLAQSIVETLGTTRPLMVPAGRRELWVWLATHDKPSLDAVESLVGHQNAHVAIGSSHPGLDGFRTSHREAANAQRLVTMRWATAGVTRYDEIELVWLMSADLDGVERLLSRELGELANNDASLDYLRETLARYLHNGCSIAATAEELFVHRNTVVYRLHRIAELVGHPLTHRRTEMDLALRLLEWH